MTGKYASKVQFIYNNIKGSLYSSDVYKRWEDEMKGAIAKDVISEDIPNDGKRLEEAHRFALAQEQVIINLLYLIKWGSLPKQPKSYDYNG